MAEFRSHRQTDTGRPGAQTGFDTGGRPGRPAGMPPEPNSGQIDLGTGYTMLRGGQDVQQPGYYFDEMTREVRHGEKGQTIGGNDSWLYLTDQQGVPRERLKSLIRERGYGGSLAELQVVGEPR